jgi:hypothetical protein
MLDLPFSGVNWSSLKPSSGSNNSRDLNSGLTNQSLLLQLNNNSDMTSTEQQQPHAVVGANFLEK